MPRATQKKKRDASPKRPEFAMDCDEFCGNVERDSQGASEFRNAVKEHCGTAIFQKLFSKKNLCLPYSKCSCSNGEGPAPFVLLSSAPQYTKKTIWSIHCCKSGHPSYYADSVEFRSKPRGCEETVEKQLEKDLLSLAKMKSAIVTLQKGGKDLHLSFEDDNLILFQDETPLIALNLSCNCFDPFEAFPEQLGEDENYVADFNTVMFFVKCAPFVE